MSLIFADIEFLNAINLGMLRRKQLAPQEVRRLTVNALVDTGAYILTINENVQLQLGLDIVDEEIAPLADGSKVRVDVAGPVEIRFENVVLQWMQLSFPARRKCFWE